MKITHEYRDYMHRRAEAEASIEVIDAMPLNADVISEPWQQPTDWQDMTTRPPYHVWAAGSPAGRRLSELFDIGPSTDPETSRGWTAYLIPGYTPDAPLPGSKWQAELLALMGDGAGLIHTERAVMTRTGNYTRTRGYLIAFNADGTRAAYVKVL